MVLLEKTLNYRLKLLRENLEIPLDGSVLDIGCGTGEISKQLSKRIAGADIKNYLKKEIRFIKIEKNKIPLKDKSFDYVTFIDSLHHMTKDKQNKLLKEAKRIAKKEIILFECKPTLRAYLFDYILNRLRYGFSIPIPLKFRKASDWRSNKIQEIKTPWWYPFKNYIIRIK